MRSPAPHRSNLFRRILSRIVARLLVSLLLVLGLLVALAGWYQTGQGLARAQTDRFDNLSGYIIELMEDRVQRSAEIMLSFAGLFQVSDRVSRAEFQSHARMMNLAERAPGMLAIQFAPLVWHAQRAAFEAAVRRDTSLQPEGYPDFLIHPSGERPFYVPILYNEPMLANGAAFGHDTASDPGRRQVMETAIDQGRPAFSPPLALLQSDSGVVIRIPVFRRGEPVATAQQRRAAFAGHVSGVFRVADVLRHAMPRQLDGFHLQVVDAGAAVTDARRSLLFDSGPRPEPGLGSELLVRRHAIQVGERTWLLTISAAAPVPWLQGTPLAVLLSGLGLSLLMFWLSRSLNHRFASASAEAERLHHGAHHDALTGLVNRRGLTERLEAVLRTLEASGGEVVLLFIDLDRFKAINDRFGHEAGDDVLRVVATRLPACLRPEDTVARLGGDEFVVLLDSGQAAEWPAVCRRLEQAVRQPMVIQGKAMAVGCSVGVALAPRDGTDAAGLMRHADRAMYASKKAARRSA